MAAVRTFTLPHYEAYPVHVALFTDVTNAAFLRTQLLEGNPQFDYAFLDASMILSPTHLLSSTLLALHLTLTQRAKTRTPHSELVFRLSPNNNIGEAYKKFGISDSSTRILAVKLNVKGDGSVDESVSKDGMEGFLGRVVEGKSVSEEDVEIGEWCELKKVRNVYKVPEAGDVGKGKKAVKTVANMNGDGAKDEGEERKKLESAVLGIIALKGT